MLFRGYCADVLLEESGKSSKSGKIVVMKRLAIWAQKALAAWAFLYITPSRNYVL